MSRLITKTYQLPANYFEALKRLRMAGYGDDQSLTQISAIRQAIQDAWVKTFPDEPFPRENNGGE